MENKHISKLKKVITDFFSTDNVTIILFGSRARNDNYNSSDVDIGIIPRADFDDRKITLLKERIERLNIPFKVEIVNLSEVSEDFKKEALKESIIWKD